MALAKSMQCAPFSVYDATVAELQASMQTGKLSSMDITSAYLNQIEKHNVAGFGVRAIIDTAPRDLVMKYAESLDSERASKGARGPLHGIPILVKDLFNTDPSLGMGTTCGSMALRQAKPRRNADIVDQLLKAGMVIIGKANLSEMANIKGIPSCTGGWSAAGGQTLSPYVQSGVRKNDTFLGHSTPAGSSSGSAAGVAAGFAPIAIGSETDGSTVYPATRAGLYGFKMAHGAFSLAGSLPFHPDFDSHGMLAKSPYDLACLLSSVSGTVDPSSFAEGKSWKGLKIGFLDSEDLLLGPGEIEPDTKFTHDHDSAIKEAKERIRSAGGEVVESVKIQSVEEIAAADGGVDFDVVAFDRYKENINAYLGDLEETPVRTLKEMIEYNREHAESCLPPGFPSQRLLEVLAVAEPDKDYDRKLSVLRKATQASIEDARKLHHLDAILATGDSRLCAVAAAAGYACGTVPLAYSSCNGRAFGLHVVTGSAGDEMLLKVLSAWETSFPEGRKAPPLLENYSANSTL